MVLGNKVDVDEGKRQVRSSVDSRFIGGWMRARPVRLFLFAGSQIYLRGTLAPRDDSSRLRIPCFYASGLSETRNDMVPSERQPALLRDVGEGGYQRRAGVPERRGQGAAAGARGFAVSSVLLLLSFYRALCFAVAFVSGFLFSSLPPSLFGFLPSPRLLFPSPLFSHSSFPSPSHFFHPLPTLPPSTWLTDVRPSYTHSFADTPYGVDLEPHETQAPGCNC